MNEKLQLSSDLLDSEETWRSLIQCSLDIIMIVDVTGTILFMNRTIEGFDLDDTLGRSAFEFVPPDYGDVLKTRLRRVYDTGIPEGQEVYGPGPKNSGAWYLSRVGPVKQNGRVVALSIVATDITDLKTSQQTLERLRLQDAALQSAANAVVITDKSGTILQINDAFTKLTGYTSEEIIGRNPRILKSGKQNSQFYRILWGTITSGQVWRGEIINRRKDGSLYTEEMTITPVKDHLNRITNYIAIKSDVTERKQLEQQLVQSQKMEAIGLLAGGVAHDFNNMLSAIMSYACIVNDKLPVNSELSRYVDEIQKAAERAGGLTRQLLAFSRCDVTEPEVLNLGKVIDNFSKMIRHLISENIELRFESATGLWPVLIDVGQIEQVVINLVINARDAMPNGGSLTVETSNVAFDRRDKGLPPNAMSDEYVVLSVSDNGEGMTPEVKAQIFEPFFTTKEVGKGTGLGLSTCYGIVNQFDGYITVDSSPGSGTKFRVYLPRTNQPASDYHQDAVKNTLPMGSETILFVEDEQLLREIAILTLRENGYSVVPATNGIDALAAAANYQEPIHLLLTDVIMPRMGGRELSEKLSSIHPETQIIYTSGYTSDPMIHQLISSQEANFLRKPFSPSQLLEKVKETLSAKV